jgi:hypothetical protein
MEEGEALDAAVHPTRVAVGPPERPTDEADHVDGLRVLRVHIGRPGGEATLDVKTPGWAPLQKLHRGRRSTRNSDPKAPSVFEAVPGPPRFTFHYIIATAEADLCIISSAHRGGRASGWVLCRCSLVKQGTVVGCRVDQEHWQLPCRHRGHRHFPLTEVKT